MSLDCAARASCACHLQLDHGSGDGQAAALAQLQQTLAQQKLAEQVGSSTKELHKAVSNLGKVRIAWSAAAYCLATRHVTDISWQYVALVDEECDAM